MVRLAEAGFPEESLEEIQKLIEAQNSDLFDVLEYIAFEKPPVSREQRVLISLPRLMGVLTPNQMSFVEFVLERYIATGVEELDDMKLPDLLKLRYAALQDGVNALGGSDQARQVFIDFQKYLYQAG